MRALLKPYLHQARPSCPLFLFHQPGFGEAGARVDLNLPGPALARRNASQKKHANLRLRRKHAKIEAAATTPTDSHIAVKVVVSVKPTVGGLLSIIGINRGRDDITDLIGKTLLLELVSAELDPVTGLEKETIKGYAHHTVSEKDEVKYESQFEIPDNFGDVGAILVENEHHKEMYLNQVVLDGFPKGPVTFTCRSWVHSKFDNPEKRVFFADKNSCLPSQTPSGLTRLRQEELTTLRGNGQGERKSFERIYDYDTYNDLGEPDSSPDKKRPVLGGKEHPYPRRCRTGRPRCKTDPLSETRDTLFFYVPRDEAFSELKELQFSTTTVGSVLHAFLPSLETAILDKDLGFPYFTAIDSLFNEGINVPAIKKGGFWQNLLPRLVKTVTDGSEYILKFETPKTVDRDKFFWFRDEEFSRQTLAGLNPLSIQLVKEWPLKSTLDPKIYGPAESAITSEIVEREIKGFMTIDEAMKQKKLFIMDYHDLLLPYVNKVREIKGTTLYGSRTLFFLTPNGTLKPVAIELTRPPSDGKPQWKQAFTPGAHATDCWLWKLAKTHVMAHNFGYHELVSHWLRTHCCTEPYIIAANRQLSAMHPIYRVLHPHFRYTMEINALAREALVNADGIIETSFSPAKYSAELSSAAYDQLWRFDLQALPADLISRGLAEEDPSAPHGLKLAIQDYPYANDGLLLWDIMKEWFTKYVSHYYPDAGTIQADEELQAWWEEIRTVGHGDKKDEPGWPELKTPQDLAHIITTMVWVATAHHAAVNFGQYDFGGYFPNQPSIARTNMPTEDPVDSKDWEMFIQKPEVTLLQCFPSQIQATRVMAILDVLSSHSPEEEYLGDVIEPWWGEDAVIKAAFERFNGRLQELQGVIDERNANPNLRNRNGAGIMPYELLKPFSEPGVTAKGVPRSISI